MLQRKFEFKIERKVIILYSQPYALIMVASRSDELRMLNSLHSLYPGGVWDSGARNARMYFEDDHVQKRVGGWCAASPKNQWLQVDLGTTKYITGVGTQGKWLVQACSACWVYRCLCIFPTVLLKYTDLRGRLSLNFNQSLGIQRTNTWRPYWWT